MKSFLWLDKTGRGETAKLTDTQIIVTASDEELSEESYADDSLNNFVNDCEIGDIWESRTERYICIENEENAEDRELSVAVMIAKDAFWKIIAELYPQAVSNHIPARNNVALVQAMYAAVMEWISINVPQTKGKKQ